MTDRIEGSISARLGDSVSSPPSDGESFVLAAREFWQGAKVLGASGPTHPRCYTLLAAQALEEALKALLWTGGKVVKELQRKPFGHDLEALWESAAKSSALESSPPQWCVNLNGFHAYPYIGRYPSGLSGLNVLGADELLQLVDRVLLLAEVTVKKSVWRKPGA